MAISGITFNNRIPSAVSQRTLGAAALTDGVLNNCIVTGSGKNITIGGGFLLCGGAIVQLVSGGESVAVTQTSGYARLKGVIDLTGTSTATSFSQFRVEVDYANSLGGFPALTQTNINGGSGTKYECELAIAKLNAAGVESIVRTAKAMPRIPYGDTLPDFPGAPGEIFLVKVE